jgi:hypothetical protein
MSARDEARKLNLARWYSPDRALTLALSRSANGDQEETKKARRSWPRG